MPTTVSDHTALLSGRSWWGGDTGGAGPLFITYSFETKPYAYLDEVSFFGRFRDSFRELSAVQRQQAEAALTLWDQASGIHFIEVPAGQGDIRFGGYDFSSRFDVRDSAAFAYYPFTTGGEVAGLPDGAGMAGDVYLGRDVDGYTASGTLHVLLHEIGHALGLKHPFEGDVQLAGAFDSTAYTVMSYNGDTPSLGALDLAAIRSIYGGDDRDGGANPGWSWNAATLTLTQSGTGAGETIRGVSSANVVAAGGGGDVVITWAGKDRIEGGAGNDRVWAGAGDDLVRGGSGRDTLDGAAGADTLEGGEASDRLSGGEGRDILRGEAGNDRLDGGTHADRLFGDDGADALLGGAGADGLEGGAGNDTLEGGDDTDTLAGGAGDDRLLGDLGDDRLDGGDGTDRLIGGIGGDTLAGGAGADWLEGGEGNDVLAGGAGDDLLNGGRGGDTADYGSARTAILVDLNGMKDAPTGTVYHVVGEEIGRDRFFDVESVRGGAGDDSLIGNAAGNQLAGGAGNDSLDGRAGADILRGEGGKDRLDGGEGDDALAGGIGNDRLDGGAGRDRLQGESGNDRLDGGAGDDNIEGGVGDDRIEGGTGGDWIIGAAGDDWIAGGEGDDFIIDEIGDGRLDGGLGNDIIQAGDGDDWIDGGAGGDFITGGAGADRFVFDTALAADDVDYIRDFTVGTDRLLLDDDVFTALKAGQLAEGQVHLGKGAHDADDRLIFDTRTKSLFYDADGLGGQAQVKIAVLNGLAALQASDFLIVV